MRHLIIVYLVMMSLAVNAGAQFVTVGSDGNCDFSTIGTAVTNGLSNEIRIATNGSPYNEHLEFDDVSKILKGGYANCTDAGNNITDLSHAIIDGSDTGAIIKIIGSDNENTVELKHLYIGNADYGVTIYQVDKVDLILDDVLNFNNNIKGIQSIGGTVNMIIKDSSITTNTNGGITCQGTNSIVKLIGNTKIENNNSINDGAGIKLYDGCDAEIYSPVKISNNTANGNGGGIHVKSSSILKVYGYHQGCLDGFCYGEDDAAVMIEDNQAGGDGGGVYIESDSSGGLIINTVFDNNTAMNGGAIAISDQSELLSGSHYNSGPCWSPGKCNQFINNKADTGGVFLVEDGAQMEIRTSWITNNRADNGIVANTQTDGFLTINNSTIVENGNNGASGYNDNELFKLSGNINFSLTSTRLEYVTIADNHVTQEIIDNDTAAIAIHSSIVAESVPLNNSVDETSSQFECLIVNETASFSAGGTVSIDDPEFINASNDDYHIKPLSPAVDYCYQINNVNLLDREFENHGFDDPNKVNLHGEYDLGADEYNVENDVIFKNSFEEL